MSNAIQSDENIDEQTKEKFEKCRNARQPPFNDWSGIYKDLLDTDYVSNGYNDNANAMGMVREYMSDTWPVHYATCNPAFDERADVRADVADSVRLAQHDREMNALAQAYSIEQANVGATKIRIRNAERTTRDAEAAHDRWVKTTTKRSNSPPKIGNKRTKLKL